MTHNLDWWLKIAQILQGFSAPLLALLLGVITAVIQFRQSRTQRQQAKVHHLQFRLQLMEKRMKGNRLHAIYMSRSHDGVTRPQDIPVDAEINEWFAAQVEKGVARDKFLKYMDFREP